MRWVAAMSALSAVILVWAYPWNSVDLVSDGSFCGAD